MNIIDEKIQELQAFQDNQAKIVINLAKEIEHLIIDMNTAQLAEKGIYNQGDSIIDFVPYTPLTISIKKSKGQPTNRVTLKDTGDFHSSFYLVYTDDYFEITADDEKVDKIEKKYGKDIYGLTEENIQEVIDLLHPALLIKFKNTI